jgi:signal transduction histidine kinase
VEFGYFFYYYPDGIQIMMPNQPATRQNVNPGQDPFIVDQNGELVLDPFFDSQSFFGTPQITFTFGWLW